MKSQVRGRFYPLTDFEIEAYLCGELDGEACVRLEVRLAADQVLRAYIEERREAQRTFAALHPLPSSFGEQLQGEASKRRERSRGLLIGIPSVSLLAVAAALALAWLKPDRLEVGEGEAETAPVEAADHVRVKGDGVNAALYVKRGEEVFEHELSLPLREGDRLRLRVDDPRGGYLTVLSRDQVGKVSVYYDSLRIAPGRSLVPDSLLLEGSFAGERWLVVVADEARTPDVYMTGWRDGKLPRARYVTLVLPGSTP